MSTSPDRTELLAAVDLGPLLEELSELEARGNAYPCPNPQHDQTGRTPPVSVSNRNGYEVWKCHACDAGGTAIDALMQARGLDAAGAFAELRKRAGRPLGAPLGATHNGRSKTVAIYNYVDEDGELLFQVLRRENKTFPQRRPNGNGGWVWNLNGTRRVLYRLPRVIAAVAAGQWVFVPEGEKDVHALEEAGVVATCNPGGAGCWEDEYAEVLRGARVAVIADKDDPGRRHAREVADSLAGVAAEVRVGEAAEGKDAADHLAAGREVREFVQVALDEVAAAEPAAEPVREAMDWPEPLDQAAYHGLAGEILRTIEPHTEADPAAMLLSFLGAFGNVIGRGAGFRVGASFHASNLYMLLVGPTSSGRKGTAGDEALRVFGMIDPEWRRHRVANGLSSGEGLVWQVRDPITKKRKAKKDEIPNLPDGWLEEIDDPGEEDKRLLVVEPEFSRALEVISREGNTLSPTLRQLWDRGDARSMVKTSPGRTTGALVSITGHITPEELRRKLGDTEIANGFVNRFLIVCSRRSKRLPFGGSLTDGELGVFAARLREAVEHGRRSREIDMDASAKRVWPGLYEALDVDRPGILGAVLRRAVPIVRRLAVIYALLDCEPAIRDTHLAAAAAVWRYCEQSARYVFGDSLGDRKADKLRDALRDARGKGLSRAQLRESIGSNNVPAHEIEAALRLLLENGLAERGHEPTGGRQAEVWRSTEAWEEREEREEREESRSPSGLTSHSSHNSQGGHVNGGPPEDDNGGPGIAQDDPVEGVSERDGYESMAAASLEEEALAERLRAEYGEGMA
ncbi:hypothetical protein AYO39_02250 [Actinobacteria bacterium SCGC AG-212-D09]|nr:hypothetical protein AYO39_02250 [Actinobacteria bacterium SCGC AG-212-D09]